MAKGILYVETRPVAGKEDEYHTWYNETHLREVVGLDGFVSARRLTPVDGDGPFVAIYEVEGDDLPAITAGLGQAVGRGDLHMSDALDPSSAVMRLLETTAVYEPDSAASR